MSYMVSGLGDGNKCRCDFRLTGIILVIFSSDNRPNWKWHPYSSAYTAGAITTGPAGVLQTAGCVYVSNTSIQ